MPNTFQPNAKTEEGGFEPIALQNHNLIVHHVNSIHYRRVDFWETVPPFQVINLGVLAAGGQTNVIALNNLQMPDDEVGQFRWWVIDNAQIRLFLPQGLQKAQLRNIASIFDMNTPLRDPNLVSAEIFVWEDDSPPNVVGVNGMGVALVAIRIIAMGYRFHTVDIRKMAGLSNGGGQVPFATRGLTWATLLEKLQSGAEPATHIWTSGRGLGGET